MTKTPKLTIETINEIIQHGVDLGVIHLLADKVSDDGRCVYFEEHELVNFSSCSYLGLEVDQRLKDASKKAIDDYGTLFAASRSFIGIKLYKVLEKKLELLFGYPTLVAPTTTLGHQSNIPTLVEKNDAVILDHQVHASVQTSVKIVQAEGTHVEMIRHNNMKLLEDRIQKLSEHHKKIWYMADGIYSMFGDAAPLKEIYNLLDKYEQFHFYVDDAHGMSWTGKNGSGYVLSQIPYHPKMILITTLAKTFGSLGSAMVFPDEETKQKVKNCGKTLMFSGPLAPACLGANIASAEIHLTNEIEEKQQELNKRIKYALEVAKAYNLPVVGKTETPVFFVGVGTSENCFEICKGMLNRGFVLSPSVYPSVPYLNAGLRFTITLNQRYEDIETMLFNLSEELESVLNDNNYSRRKIFRAFAKHGFFKEELTVSSEIKIKEKVIIKKKEMIALR